MNPDRSAQRSRRGINDLAPAFDADREKSITSDNSARQESINSRSLRTTFRYLRQSRSALALDELPLDTFGLSADYRLPY
jgi:hypothetical protein